MPVADADLVAAEGTLGSWLIQTRDQILMAIASIPAGIPGSIGALPNDGTAVLALKQLAIVNDSGIALKAWSTGGDAAGIDAKGHHGIRGEATVDTGSGMHLRGYGGGGNGGDGLSLQGVGVGAGLAAHGGLGTAPGVNAGPGIYAVCDAGNGAGLQLKAAGTLAGLLVDGGTTGQGALIRGGSAGAAGIRAEGTGTGFAGMALVGTGTAPGLKTTIAF